MFDADSEHRTPCWLEGTGPAADIVVSTRVRLARNLQGIQFTHRAGADELAAVQASAAEAVMQTAEFARGWRLDLESCTAVQRQCLLEMHLVSPALLRRTRHRSLLLSADLSRSVMVNEEDHLRAQYYRSGFDPEQACERAIAFDNLLEEQLEFAYSDELGYLTTCPTNVGTGLRLSVLIHLPGLVLTQETEKILNSLRQLQFAVRGLFGEGSAVRGALFQVSNLVTLGRSEEVLTGDFKRHVGKVIQYEKLAREQLYEKDAVGVLDMAQRSLAVLRNAHLITAQETFDRLSHVRMGVAMGIVPAIPMANLNLALVKQRAGHLQLAAGGSLRGRERTAARASYLRTLLA